MEKVKSNTWLMTIIVFNDNIDVNEFLRTHVNGLVYANWLFVEDYFDDADDGYTAESSLVIFVELLEAVTRSQVKRMFNGLSINKNMPSMVKCKLVDLPSDGSKYTIDPKDFPCQKILFPHNDDKYKPKFFWAKK